MSVENEVEYAEEEHVEEDFLGGLSNIIMLVALIPMLILLTGILQKKGEEHVPISYGEVKIDVSDYLMSNDVTHIDIEDNIFQNINDSISMYDSAVLSTFDRGLSFQCSDSINAYDVLDLSIYGTVNLDLYDTATSTDTLSITLTDVNVQLQLSSTVSSYDALNISIT